VGVGRIILTELNWNTRIKPAPLPFWSP